MTFSYITKTSVFGFTRFTIVEDSTLEQYFVDCEIVEQENFFTATKGNIVSVGFIGNYEEIINKYEKNSLPQHYLYNLIINIMMQDYVMLREKLHSGNAHSCNIFATITGLKFKLNNRAIDAALRGFCLPDSIAMAEAMDARQLERQQLQNAEDRKNRIIREATSAQVRHNDRVISMAEWVDTLLAQGYQVEVTPTGRVYLVKDNGSFNLSKKGFTPAANFAKLKLEKISK